MATVFEIAGPVPRELRDIMVGPWAARPGPGRPEPAGLSFAAPSGRNPGAREAGFQPVWRVDLAGTAADAHAALTAGARSVAGTESLIAALPDRLDAALRDIQSGAGNVSFGAPLAGPEAGLAADLASLLPPGRGPGVSGSIQFSSAADSPSGLGWSGLAARAEDALQSIMRFVLYHAWVETSIRGVLQVRSAMGISGDTEIVLARNPTPEIADLHMRSVSLAVRSRNAWTRLLTTVVQGTAKIAALSVTPTGLIAALPAAWSFVKRVLADVENLRKISNETT